MSVTIMPASYVPRESPNPPAENYIFSDLVSGREDEFPVLARALRETEPARSFRIEWIQDDLRRACLVQKTNYTQIVRMRHFLGDDEKWGSLTSFLSAIEEVLINGKPSSNLFRPRSGPPLHTCGGYRHYLRRKHLRDTDTLILSVLREPRWRGEWFPVDPVGEWLAEFSLRVIPG